jgi:hypothetical protein
MVRILTLRLGIVYLSTRSNTKNTVVTRSAVAQVRANSQVACQVSDDSGNVQECVSDFPMPTQTCKNG